MSKLSDAEKWKLLADYDATQAASVIGGESQAQAGKIAEKLGVSYIAEVVSHLDSDSAAELLRSLPEDFRKMVVEKLQRDQFEKLKDIQEILSYPEGTAGSIMSKEVLYVP